MRRAVLLFALIGCKQIFGLDPPRLADAGIEITPMTDAHRIDTQPGSDAYATVSFQQGIAQYVGASDCYIDSGSPNASKPTDSQLRWRASTRYGLLQFQSIFSPSMVPAGSHVVSARIDVQMNNVNCTGHIADVAIAWSDQVTYNSFGPTAGVDTTDLGTPGEATPTSGGLQSLNVTDSLVRWSADPTTNHGWMFIADAGGGECNFASSDDGLPQNRPRLLVTFSP